MQKTFVSFFVALTCFLTVPVIAEPEHTGPDRAQRFPSEDILPPAARVSHTAHFSVETGAAALRALDAWYLKLGLIEQRKHLKLYQDRRNLLFLWTHQARLNGQIEFLQRQQPKLDSASPSWLADENRQVIALKQNSLKQLETALDLWHKRRPMNLMFWMSDVERFVKDSERPTVYVNGKPDSGAVIRKGGGGGMFGAPYNDSDGLEKLFALQTQGVAERLRKEEPTGLTHDQIASALPDRIEGFNNALSRGFVTEPAMNALYRTPLTEKLLINQLAKTTGEVDRLKKDHKSLLAAREKELNKLTPSEREQFDKRSHSFSQWENKRLWDVTSQTQILRENLEEERLEAQLKSATDDEIRKQIATLDDPEERKRMLDTKRFEGDWPLSMLAMKLARKRVPREPIEQEVKQYSEAQMQEAMKKLPDWVSKQYAEHIANPPKVKKPEALIQIWNERFARDYEAKELATLSELRARLLEMSHEEKEALVAELPAPDRVLLAKNQVGLAKQIADHQPPSSEAKRNKVDYFGGEADPKMATFLSSLGIKEWHPTHSQKSNAGFYNAPACQGSSKACTGFAVATDMEFTYNKGKPEKDRANLSEWYAYRLFSAGLNWKQKSKHGVPHEKLNHVLAEDAFGTPPDDGAIPDYALARAQGVPELSEFPEFDPERGYGENVNLRDIKRTPYRIGEVAQLRDWNQDKNKTPLKLDHDFFRMLVDNEQDPMVTVSSEARIQTENTISPVEGGIPHVFKVVGYLPKEHPLSLDPKTFEKTESLILLDSFLTHPTLTIVPSREIENHTLYVDKILSVTKDQAK